MVFINQPHNVTMTPGGNTQQYQAYQQSLAVAQGGKNINQCKAQHSIMQNGGRNCIMNMCACLGCNNGPIGCPDDPNYAEIVKFCGEPSPCFAWNGAWFCQDTPPSAYTISDDQQGPLPNVFNVMGLYNPVIALNDGKPYNG